MAGTIKLDGATFLEKDGGNYKITNTELKLKSSGNTLVDSSGNAVLSESGGTVTLTANEANVGSNALVVDSSGNVGIGTIPDKKFHVIGSEGATSFTSYGARDFLVVENNQNTNIQIISNSSNSGAILFSDESVSGQGRIVYSHSTDALSLYSNSTERMRIDSSGALIYSGGVYAATKRVTSFTLTGGGSTDTLFDLWSGDAGRGHYLISVTRSGASVGARSLVIVASSSSSVSSVYSVLDSTGITVGVSGSDVTASYSGAGITVNAIAIPLAIDGN